MSKSDLFFDFSGRVLLISGASGGIPGAVARRFHAAGAALYLTDLRAEPLAKFAATLDDGSEQSRVALSAVDVTQPEQVARAVADCTARFGGIDFLVTGAGLYEERLIAETSDAEWHRGIAVNLDGVFHFVRAALPAMRDGGTIVNIASMAGHRGSRAHAAYAAAKGAVLSFTRSLAQEVAPRGIRCNNVSPGLIDTPMVQGLMSTQGETLLKATPLGRLGTADEVADVVAFLCSDGARFVTAETIHVNGGLYIAS